MATPGSLPGTSGGSTTDYLFATSVGLDRPMVDILTDIRRAMDPTNRTLTWGGNNPCMPWTGSSINQAVRRASVHVAQAVFAPVKHKRSRGA